MNWLPAWTTWQFAAAGAACAAIPTVIHLLNRRRHRVVAWAAMELLREAMREHRRLLRLRDLVLLALRTLAVLLVGLALAQPYFAARRLALDDAHRLHAVLLIDNSPSMSYETLEGTLLDVAKRRAKEFIERLPAGSVITVVPLGGSTRPLSVDPYRSAADAARAVETIAIVDRGVQFPQVVEEIRRACAVSPELAKRVVLLGDQQRANWSEIGPVDDLADLPAWQIVPVTPDDRAEPWENVSVGDLRIQDGLADVETPAVIVASLDYWGATRDRVVQAHLSVWGEEVARKSVTLAGVEGTQLVSFEHLFHDQNPTPGQPSFAPVSVHVTPDDALRLDNVRDLIVPVVASLPAVFIDQVRDADEDPLKNRLGETRHLRKLLAPTTRGSRGERELIQIRHLTLAEVARARQDALADARLVVIAGVADPTPIVDLLRQYVDQGGQLVIAAGADFQAATWNQAAWRDGAGILPARLTGEFGALPGEATELEPMSIDFDSLGGHPYFQLADVGEDELRDLYAEPFFFKVIHVDLRDPAPAGLARADAVSEARWLVWREESPVDLDDGMDSENATRHDSLPAQAAPRESTPQVRVRLVGPAGPPLIIERPMGRGSVTFIATGLLSPWNTWPKTNTFLMLDRILRGKIRSTLPSRNYTPRERIVLPWVAADRLTRPYLLRPDRSEEELDAGFISGQSRGITINKPYARGTYVVSTRPAGADQPRTDEPRPDDQRAGTKLRRDVLAIAVGGDRSESDLTRVDPAELRSRLPVSQIRVLDPRETISLSGAAVHGRDSWWWMVLAIVGLLIFELAILGRPV